jgi:hypothetical protein
MKLFEVIDDQIIRDEFTTAEEWFEQLDDLENEDTDALGAGAFSAVVPVDIPGEVKKILYGGGGAGFDDLTDIKDDAYVMFITAIAENNATDGNPYLPRISKINVIKGRDDKYYLEIFMERLSNISKIDGDMAVALARKMYGESPAFDVMEKAISVAYDDKGSPNTFRIIMIEPLRRAIRGNASPRFSKFAYDALKQDLANQLLSDLSREAIRVTDEELIKAINLIRNLKEVQDDLHFNNVMIRRTSVGPQLVIIDPVA